MAKRIHELKTWPLHFKAVKDGRKTFEVRKNDRGYQVGDELLLREFTPDNYWSKGVPGGYTGEIVHRKISCILKGEEWGIMPGFVAMGIEKV